MSTPRRSLGWRATTTLLSLVPAACGTDAASSTHYLEDADPMALTWAAPQPGDAIEVAAPYDLVVATQNPAARVVHFAVDGAEVGACDAQLADPDCHDGDLWRWSVAFATTGTHHVAVSFAGADGGAVTVATDVSVVAQISDPTLTEEGSDDPDPLADSQQVDEGTSQVVDAITSGRGFLDPNTPTHAQCDGRSWRVDSQRVLLTRGRLDGSTSQVSRCVARYGDAVARYADLDYVSRGNVIAALAADGDCEPDGAWQRNPITAAQCAALNPGTTAAACAAQMQSSADFAVEQLARYLASRPVRARHHNDPVRVGAVLGSGGALACSRRNAWHLLERAGYVDRFVAAYNAYRTRESGGAVTIPSGTSTAPNVAAIGFTVQPTAVLAQHFVGVGAQFNQNLSTPTTAARYPGITTTASLAALHSQLVALAPRHVRIFFDSHALTDTALLSSFEQTVQLAQDAGATVNVTYWHGPYTDPGGQMHALATELNHLHTSGITAVQYVTIQNEVDSTRIPFALYEQLYRALDAELRTVHLRDSTQLIGGDLVRDGQGPWLQYMARNMADVLDGYSVHIYWPITHPEYLVTRLVEVRKLADQLPVDAHRPLYVTEYGTVGDASGGPSPGLDPSGNPISETALTAYQHGWFDVYAASLGYVGLVKWDAYPGAYDNTPQDFSLLGPPANGWSRRPAFYVTQLMDHVAYPGQQVVRVDGGSDLARVAAMRRGDDWTVLAASGASVGRYFRVSGLPAGRPFFVVSWARAASEELGRAQVTSDTTGALTFHMPPDAIAGFSTVDPGL